MMSKITILHLSDIHFKKHSRDENKTFRKDVQTKMTDAIKEHIKKYMAPDVVAVRVKRGQAKICIYVMKISFFFIFLKIFFPNP